MNKALKIMRDILLWAIAIVLLAVITLPLWVGPVVTGVANWKVPKVTGTDFHLGKFSLNQYLGRLEVGDLQLSNPAGFSERNAATLGRLYVDVDMKTVLSDKIHVREIDLENVFVSYVSDNGVNNFEQIQINAAGGKEAYERQKAEAKKAEAKAEEAKASEEAKEGRPDAAEAEAGEKPGKKVIIDKLVLNGVKVKVGFATIPIPTLTLTDIGKESDGATWKDAWNAILKGILEAGNLLGDGAKALGNLAVGGASALGSGAMAVGEGAVKGAKAIGDGASKALKGVSGSIKTLFK